MAAKMFSDPSMAERYQVFEKYMVPYASALIDQSGAVESSKTGPLVVLDNASGTGVIPAVLYEKLGRKDGVELMCGDFSDSMVKYLEERIKREGWTGAEARTVDAQKTGLPSNHYTHVFTQFAAQLMPDDDAFLSECFRMLKPGGKCSIATWQSVGWYDDFAGGIGTIPNAPPFPGMQALVRSWGGNGEWDRPEYAKEVLEAHGFRDVKIQLRPNTTRTESAAKLVGLTGPMVRQILPNFWSKEDLEKLGDSIQPAVLKFMENKYGKGEVDQDGWMAVLVTGTKSSAES